MSDVCVSATVHATPGTVNLETSQVKSDELRVPLSKYKLSEPSIGGMLVKLSRNCCAFALIYLYEHNTEPTSCDASKAALHFALVGALSGSIIFDPKYCMIRVPLNP